MNPRRTAVLAFRAVIGGVFVYAAYTKLRQPWLLFAMSIDSYGMLSEWAVLAVARTLPWFELAVGALLLTGVWLRYVSAAAATLLGVFFTVMILAYARGLGIDCGCFGVGEALSPSTLARDGALLGIAIALAVLSARTTVRNTNS